MRTRLRTSIATSALLGACAITLSCPTRHSVTQPPTTQLSTNEPSMHAESEKASQPRHYGVYLIWIKDPDKWQRYRELAAPIARRYGAVERTLRADKIFLEGRTPPDLVNIVYSPSRADFAKLDDDEAFRKIVHLRTESTDLMYLQGESLAGEVSQEGIDQRMYLVEIANFGPAGAPAYHRYEAESEPVLQRYGYHVERVLNVREHSPGWPFEPDLVKVSYFDQRDGMSRMEADPEHGRIEALYPSVVKDSIWIFATSTCLQDPDRVSQVDFASCSPEKAQE